MSFCIPHLLDVPGLAAPPRWVDDMTGGPRYRGHPKRVGLGDPRWRNAGNQSFGVGTSEEVTFRAGYHIAGGQTSLFFSWHVKFDGQPYDPSGSPDRLWVGLEPAAGGGSPFTLIIDLPHNEMEPLEAENPGPIERRPLSYTSSSAALSLPDWVNHYTRVWRDTTSAPPSFKQEWAVQMMVPVNPAAMSEADNAGVNLGSSFKMWYTVDIDTPRRVDSTTTGINGGILRIPDPMAITVSTSPGGVTTITVPSTTTSNWEQYTLGAITDPSCTNTNAISLDDNSRTGTMNMPSNQIKFTLSGPNPHANTFFARPTNKSGATIPQDQIKAVFRIANWGSSTAEADSWVEIPHTGDIDNKAAIPNNTTADASNQVEFNWTVGEPYLSNLRNTYWDPTSHSWRPRDATLPTMYWHNCMFVQLSGAGLVFTKDSVFDNMDFEPASLIERGAELDLGGLAPITPPNRDVYIMPEKLNMPARTPAGYNEGQFLQGTIDRLIREGDGNNEFVQKLQQVQSILSHSTVPGVELRTVTAPLDDYFASLEYTDKEAGLASLGEFMQALEAWLNAVKPDAAAAKRLSLVARAFADWLGSTELIDRGKKLIQFMNALNRWLSGLDEDPASTQYGTAVLRTLQAWLKTLRDTNGSLGRLGRVVDSLEEWIKSGRAPGQLLEVLNALREWLSTLSNEDWTTRAVLTQFSRELSLWLVGTSERLAHLVSVMKGVGFTNAELDQVFPTCRFHVYYDTGQRWQENGRTFAILGLQPSFGFYAYHENQLDGWQTSIYGAKRVADNLYVISAPATGKTSISTIIQAVEPGEARIPEDPIGSPGGGAGCCGAVATWLDTKGPIGKLLAVVVRFICRLVGQLTSG